MTVLAATAGVVMALLLAGWSNGLALLAYVLFLGAVALVVLIGQLRGALPQAPRFERLLAAPPRRAEPVGQLETIRRVLAAAGWSQAELYYRLAPMIREIAAARLSRRHGVDLDRQPERARALIGAGRVWELVRPGRERADNWRTGGWSRQELEELLDELEGI
ncbi:MAG: hypothetical protein ACRDNT_22085 [Streptosporangiaceae bacterium]